MTAAAAFLRPIRFAAILPVALATTLLLLFAMFQLVKPEGQAPAEAEPVEISPIVLEPRAIEILPDPLQRPEDIEVPPEMVIDHAPPDVETAGEIYRLPPPAGVPDDIATDPHAVDGQLVSITKVQPHYAPHLVAREIEGFVDVAFDITTTGRTENIRVVASQPEGVFDRAVIRAVKQWRYRPTVQNGEPRRTRDVVERVSFRLEGQ